MLLLLTAVAIAVASQVPLELFTLLGVAALAGLCLLPWPLGHAGQRTVPAEPTAWTVGAAREVRVLVGLAAVLLLGAMMTAERYGLLHELNVGMPIRYVFAAGMVAIGRLAYSARPRRFVAADDGLWSTTLPLLLPATRRGRPRRLFLWTDVLAVVTHAGSLQLTFRLAPLSRLWSRLWSRLPRQRTVTLALPALDGGPTEPSAIRERILALVPAGVATATSPRLLPAEAHPPSHWKPILVIFAVTAVLSNLPFLLAELSPPPGRVFVGTFAYTVDYLDYLAHAQQAEDGHFFLGSKYYPHPHAANYVNLEWWLVGTLSRLLGRHPVLAYRLVGLAALFLFVVVLDRWLRRAGLPARHRAAALTLVLSGAGLGGLRFLVGHTPLYLCMDLLAGLFPVIEILYNPHFVIGTALLLVCLDLFASAKSLRGVLLAVLMGTVVGLMRPYELVILTATHLLVAAAHDPPRLWPRRIAPVVGLVPVLLFNLVTLVRNPAFAFHQSPHYGMPPASRFVLALLPASLLSLVALGLPRADEQTRHARMVLAGWAVLGLLMIVAPPFFFTAQVLVGVGLPCLVLAALGLARWRPGVTWAVAAVMGTTGLVALYGMVARPETAFVPRERWQIAQAAREPCRQGGILLSPADIGRYVGALTACQPVISHPYLLDAHEVSTEVEALFNTAAPTAWRTFIERWDVTHLALPNAVATRAEQALGPSSAFRRLAALGSGDDEVVLFGPARDGAHERRP